MDEPRRIPASGADEADRSDADDIETLRARNTLYREAELLAGIGSWDIDLRSQVVTWSEGLRRLLGFSPTVSLTEAAAALLYEEDRAEFQRAIDRASTEGTSFDVIGRVDHGVTGERVWIRIRGGAWRGPDGSITRVYGVTQDVTATHARDIALEQAQAQARTAERLAKTGSWQLDYDEGTASASEGVYAIFGRGFKVGDTDAFWELVHPDDLERTRAIIEGAMASRVPFDVEYRIVRDNGDVVWIRSLGEPLLGPDGRLSKFVGAAQDITHQKLAEERLREGQRAEQEFIDALTDFTVKLTPDGAVLRAGGAAARAFGGKPSDFVGVNWTQGPWWGGDAKAAELVRSHLIKAARGERVRFSAPVDVGDLRRIFDVILTPVTAPSGEVAYVIAEGRDVTREQQLQGSLASERRRLALANADLEAFSYTVSHDLKAPLRGMDVYLAALEEDHAEELSPDARSLLDQVRAERARMTILIADLLAHARATRGEVHRTPLDVSAMAADVVAILAQREPDRNVECTIEPGMDAEADLGLTRILLENLIGNAWKFTRREPRARIEVGVAPKDGGSAFFVKDNGVGFDPSQAHELFRPFKQLRSTEGFGGTGVGLATARRIIEAHGGRIWAEGALGVGATFWFTLAP